MALTCELCGSTNFLKDQGVFVCQECGCKYTLEEAREIMARVAHDERQAAQEVQHRRHDPDARASAQKPAASEVTPAPEPSPVPTMHAASDFSQAVAGGLQGAQAVNNYACQGWQLLLDEYKRLDHPSKARQDELGARAREILLLLDNAARLEPENHVQDLLIFENCEEIVSAAHWTDYYDKDSEGKWRRHSFGLDVKLPGQSNSWDELIKFHRSFVEQRYLEGHPDEQAERDALVAQREEIEGRLAELKSEKRGKGLFNFAEKREVKDRMKPVQQELSQVNKQISDLDDNVDAYVEKRLKELESGYIRLK